MRPLPFVLSGLLAALVFALLVKLLLLYPALGIAPADRPRIQLLALWTAGVLAICFGTAAYLTKLSPIGFRDVAEAGSLTAALEMRREGRARTKSAGKRNFATWTILTGCWLILLYFLSWLVFSR